MIILPTAFGTQTLHNGTTHFATKTLMPSDKADSRLIRLPNNTWYDPYLSEPMPPMPGKLMALVALVYPNLNTLSTEIDSIYTWLGKRAVLRVTKTDTTTLDCEARLETISLKHPFHLLEGGRTKIEFTFQCITRFS